MEQYGTVVVGALPGGCNGVMMVDHGTCYDALTEVVALRTRFMVRDQLLIGMWCGG